jgi:glucoamylase
MGAWFRSVIVRRQPVRTFLRQKSSTPDFLNSCATESAKPGDPLIEDSLKVVDAVLKVDFPSGPCWRRYTHDGYGQRDDGAAFEGWGTGRPWPLLTGERGHYELAAGRDPTRFIRALENFATPTRLLPEQIWDLPDRPNALMYFGKPTGAAMPLMWAHAEYVKLVRSAQNGEVFDRVPEVASRYRLLGNRRGLEIWKPNRKIAAIDPRTQLRILAAEAFILHWTRDDWQSASDTASSITALNLHSVDIPPANDLAPIRFTFFWTESGRWEGRDYTVAIRSLIEIQGQADFTNCLVRTSPVNLLRR